MTSRDWIPFVLLIAVILVIYSMNLIGESPLFTPGLFVLCSLSGFEAGETVVRLLLRRRRYVAALLTLLTCLVGILAGAQAVQSRVMLPEIAAEGRLFAFAIAFGSVVGAIATIPRRR